MRAKIQPVLKAMDRHEDAAALALLLLLAAAMEELRQRIALIPTDSVGAITLSQVRQAITDGMSTLTGLLARRFGQDVGLAVSYGAQLADAALPQPGAFLHLAYPMDQALPALHASLLDDVTAKLGASLTTGFQIGLMAGTPVAQIAASLGLGAEPAGPVARARAQVETIARTEVNRAYNVATQQRMEQAAMGRPLRKEWVTQGDLRVRPTHAAAEGQTVPVSEPFVVGGFSAMYPGDPSLPPSEVCNCRCRSVPVLPGK